MFTVRKSSSILHLWRIPAFFAAASIILVAATQARAAEGLEMKFEGTKMTVSGDEGAQEKSAQKEAEVEKLKPEEPIDPGLEIKFEGSKMTVKDPSKPSLPKLEGQVKKKEIYRQILKPEKPGRDYTNDDHSQDSSVFNLKGQFDTGRPEEKPTAGTKKLRGDVSMNVPKTPDEVADYLRRMREILKNYESTAISDLFQGGNRVNMKNINVGGVQGETVDMIGEINSITPPAELKTEHYQLAKSLSAVRNLVAPGSSLLKNPTAALARMGPSMRYLQSTLNSYHSGVLAVIAQYHLPMSLDPLGDQNQQENQMLKNAYGDLSGQLMNKEARALSGSGSSGASGGLGGMESLLGGAGGGGTNLSDLSRMLGGSGAGLSSLSKMMGGQGLGGENSLPNLSGQLGSLKKLMGGHSSSGFDSSIGTDAAPSPYGAAARSADSMSDDFGSDDLDDGGFGNTDSDSFGDDGFADQ